MALYSEYERLVDESQRTVQPDGSNRRIHAITFRWVHGRMLPQPASQKAHIFFSEVTGRYSKRVLTISGSARRSRISVGMTATPGGKHEVAHVESIEACRIHW